MRLEQNVNKVYAVRRQSLMLAAAAACQPKGKCTADMSVLEIPVPRADQLWCAASTTGTLLKLTFDIRFLFEQLHDAGSTRPWLCTASDHCTAEQ